MPSFARYYNGQGAADRVRIDIPVGSYVPTFTISPHGPRPPQPNPAYRRQPADDQRIAVLPIVNMSADPENQYFCDGLTEELINRLAQTPQLRVVARTSSFQFKDAARDIREVGRLLDVSKVLEGSVRKAGNRIRVTVQLINVADGCHLWSERYEGDLTDIFAIHEQISTAVQRALQMTDARARSQARRSHAPAGARSCTTTICRDASCGRREPSRACRAALDHFERGGAARSDVRASTLGHRRLSSDVGDVGRRGARPMHAQSGRSRDEGFTARRLARPKHMRRWRPSRTATTGTSKRPKQGYRRAMALDPSYATALHWLGLFFHAAGGRFAEAVDSLEQAIELDPLSPPIIADLALVHAFREDFDAAAMYCRRALELDPHFHRPFWFLGLTQCVERQFSGG